MQEIFKRFFQPLYIPVLCLIACMLFLNSKIKSSHNLNKIIIFIFGFLIIFFSEIMIKYTGVKIQYDFFILFFPFVLLLTIYLFIIKIVST